MTRHHDRGTGGERLVRGLQFVPRDRFDLARDLVDNLSDAGLCAASAWECAPPTVSVSARLVGADPRSSRTVWCLPWPGRDVLYWQWRRTAYRGGVIVGRWCEPLCPIADTLGAAAHLIAAVRLLPGPGSETGRDEVSGAFTRRAGCGSK
ncbi:hypothetical protein [Spirillospora sp. NPDC048824]|uniref:hypothetical protein n=1 Tax=Spirillospora sp. NPDC048824 TaxID=3364526 RepID=UPI003713C349